MLYERRGFTRRAKSDILYKEIMDGNYRMWRDRAENRIDVLSL